MLSLGQLTSNLDPIAGFVFWVFALISVIQTWWSDDIARKTPFLKSKYFLLIFNFLANIFFNLV
jgi:hypothetical protein